ncbi:MAG: antibiotic biosynthesis monooxygenase [Rhodoferax sp.]|nr:antibiotic biosynthesis monooxygenase [Rhodoferax sp.]MBP9928740.1 antibiotic biosynthesis monooxygenase [Rhodoferax sp.]HQZ05263.1 putative quinol monooxygenase [Burkholderiaceae bacterium]HRA62832.1 putative quinol monooxygenase [Burkholderiaceae bacterium]
MQALIVEFRIKSGQVDAFDAAITRNARDSRETEPGCRQFDVCRCPQDPQLFFLYELYDDDAAIATHLQSAHFKTMDSATAAWIESKSVRQFLRTAP